MLAFSEVGTTLWCKLVARASVFARRPDGAANTPLRTAPGLAAQPLNLSGEFFGADYSAGGGRLRIR